MASTRAQAFRKFIRETWYMLPVSLVLALVIELLNHHTPEKLILFLTGHPWMFLFNVEIIFNTFLFAELFRRRRGTRWALGILWVVLGAVNSIVQVTRVLPFTTRDVLLIPDGLKMITVYFKWYEIAGMFVGAALLIAGIVLLVVRCRKREPFDRAVSVGVFCAVTALTLVVGKVSVEVGDIDWEKTSLVDAYQNYGFAYGFTYTFADFGISRPTEYSEELVEEIADDVIEPTAAPEPEEAEPLTPNVVFVQLESFFNVHDLVDAEYSREPIPVFRELMETCPHGQLKVPSVGGGTANTEFEVLTGMNLDYFGAGEFPYNTILQDTTCETVAFNLKELGYTATAVHNYTGTFYGRNTVYAQLGFDRFVPQEYMNGLTYNALGWAHDSVLTGETMKALTTTPGRDFVFTVTVQSHGKYPDTPVEGLDDIAVLAAPETVNATALQNYVNELSQVDAFIGALIDELEDFDEPTVLVLYGDHLPALGIETDELATGDLYQTTYVLWNNFGLDMEGGDLQAFQLSAYVLGQLNIHTGILTRFHQNFAPDCDEDDYLSFLRVLEYDMLYGDHNIYGGDSPYQPTELQLGTEPIVCESFTYDPATATISVYGQNFTTYSDILVDGERKNAVFADETRLIARANGVTEDSRVRVGQFTREGDELGRSGFGKMREISP
ncbi:MAG TPA: LTA synthase family protein [Candidatus Pullichristensenella stercoripullorum]|nr:LTA synthase family protein [Candidatus Pullichristensenella stercoripullorum]